MKALLSPWELGGGGGVYLHAPRWGSVIVLLFFCFVFFGCFVLLCFQEKQSQKIKAAHTHTQNKNSEKSQNNILHVKTSPYVKIKQDPVKKNKTNFTKKAIYSPFA